MNRRQEIFDDDDDQRDKLLGYTVDIVTAHLAHNSVALGDVPQFIFQVHGTLTQLGVQAPEAKPEPIVSIASSVRPDYIICLECGRKLQKLTAHLRAHGLTPDEYREKWELPASYPMVSKNCSAQMSALAISTGRHEKMRAAREAKRAKRAKAGKAAMRRPLASVGGRANG